MDGLGRNGGRGSILYGPALGGHGAGRFSSFPSGRSRGTTQAGYYTRGNPLWADPMDQDQSHHQVKAAGLNQWAREHGTNRTRWENSSQCKDALLKIAEITTEDWNEQEFVECHWDYEDATYEVDKLGAHAMIC
ncbi:unnamed protein product [Calypogeia fissa]